MLWELCSWGREAQPGRQRKLAWRLQLNNLSPSIPTGCMILHHCRRLGGTAHHMLSLRPFTRVGPLGGSSEKLAGCSCALVLYFQTVLEPIWHIASDAQHQRCHDIIVVLIASSSWCRGPLGASCVQLGQHRRPIHGYNAHHRLHPTNLSLTRQQLGQRKQCPAPPTDVLHLPCMSHTWELEWGQRM